MLCSNIRGNTDLIENNVSGLIADNTPEGVEKAIMYMLENDKLREQMAEEAMKHIKKFDLAQVEQQMYKIYQEVLA